MSYIGATGLTEYEERFDTIEQEIDSNATYINTLVGIPDPIHLATFGINVFNPSLYGLVERAEVNISALQVGEDGLSTDLSTLTTQVEGIQTEVTAIQGEITAIQGEITAIEGQITAVEGDIFAIQFTEIPTLAGVVSTIGGVAGDALSKANKCLNIWDEDGNNTYNMKSGNVGIGILPKGTALTNKLEVNGSINIPTNSKYKINNVPFSYSDLAGTPPVSSKWTNATDVATNIYYSTGNVGIGVTSAINNKLEVGGSINIPTGSKYKINNIDLSYNDLTNKLTAGTNISIVSGAINNTLTAGTNISIVSGAINNTLTAGTNISIVSGAINNTYSLPTAGVGSGGTLGGVKVDGNTITITNGIISSVSTASGASISLDGSTNNRFYGWSGSTGLLGRVGVAETYSTGSAVEDIVLRSQGKLILQSGTTNPAMVIDTGNNVILRNAVGIGSSTIAANNILDIGGVFRVGNNVPLYSFLVANSTGNVGMGTTAETNSKLHLHKSGASLVKIHFTDGFTGTASTNGLTIYKSSADEGYFWNYQNKPLIFGTNNLERLRILEGGNIGIGTTSPSSRLHIHTTLNNQNLSLQFTDNSTLSGGLLLNKSTNNNGYLLNYENASLLFGTNSLERMRISADGNVGIGTTNPTALLDIVRSVAGTGSVDVLNLRLDANWGIKIAQNYTGAGNVQYELIHRYNTNNYTSLIFKGIDTIIPEILQIGSLTGGAFNSTIRLRVYGSDNTGTAAIFKHPNDTQGIGIRYHEIYQTNSTSDPFSITATGTGGLRFNTGGNLRMTISSTGVVSFPTFTWHTCTNGNQRFYFGASGTTYLRGHSAAAVEIRSGGDNALVRFNDSSVQFFNGGTSEIARLDNVGNWSCNLVSFSGSGHDYVGVADVNTSTLQNNYRTLRGMISTFTGFHRCYVEDELFSEENVDIFRNEYVGRIVISTGKIKTDMTLKKKKEPIIEPIIEDEEPIIEDITENEEPITEEKQPEDEYEWYSLENKEGITIEDALPIVQLSRVRKDKRIYGVLGDPKRSSNNKCRITINGCGEGAMCVANTNGNIENGDYIQTSDLLGYGEKQDDDIHRNYTIAKAVMDCTFELDNPNYECKELASGVRVAMIACVYKAS